MNDLRQIHFEHQNRKRNIWIIVLLISVILLLSAIGVLTYFAIFNDCDNETITPIESTTLSEVTTTTAIPETTTLISDFSEYYKTRDAWNASEPKNSEFSVLTLPIKRIIIAHTGGSHCDDEIACRSLVKNLQNAAFESELNDIAYNFLIGNDGYIYEGRGFEIQGEHTENLYATEYSSIGICITFMGNHLNTPPSSNQIDIFKKFIDFFVKNGMIYQNYIIVAQDDLTNTNPKADALVEAMKSFDNFHSLLKIHRRDEWNAASPKQMMKFNRTMDWIMLTHTVSALCTTLANCLSYVKSLQNYQMNINFDDIFANFLIGGDGLVFEGRGWDNIPEHTAAYNSRTIGIGLIGDFTENEPNEMIFDNMIRLFDEGLLLGKLTDDFVINGQSDFIPTLSPGEGVMKHVREWCRYGNRTTPC